MIFREDARTRKMFVFQMKMKKTEVGKKAKKILRAKSDSSVKSNITLKINDKKSFSYKKKNIKAAY